jgi:hypothetical protein
MSQKRKELIAIAIAEIVINPLTKILVQVAYSNKNQKPSCLNQCGWLIVTKIGNHVSPMITVERTRQ